MIEGLVSVILPVYNVEKYLDRCIESVVRQTYKRIEIILVDDGSTDSCQKKCDDWKSKDNRIKVVHKVNAGLGYARNTGIENAIGEYICFFDSDDTIANDTIEKTVLAAKESGSELVLFGHYDVDYNGQIKNTYIPNTHKRIYIGEEVQRELLPELISHNPQNGEKSNLCLSACFCLYSTRLINKNNWRFVSERNFISEDVYSLLMLYKYVQKVVIIPEAFYYYYENSSSLTHTYRSDRYLRIKDFYLASEQLCCDFGYGPEIMQRLVYPFISNTIAAMKMICKSDHTTRDKVLLIKEIIDDDILQSVLDTIKYNKDKKSRKILFYFMNKKMYVFVFLLLKIKCRK